MFHYFLIAFLSMFFLSYVSPSNFFVFLLSIPFIFFSFILLIWSLFIFNSKKTTILPYKNPNKLITNGPFRFSRNPIYLGFLLFLIGTFFFLGSIANIIPIMLFIVVANHQIKKEEKALSKLKGFKEYRKKVRRWI